MTESLKKTLLLVDDSPCIRHVWGAELTRDGYEVVLAAHGKEALAQIGQQTFDLIILDMHMRPVNGFEVMARVRAEHPAIPIIAHTSLPRREVERRSVQLPDAYVLKGSDCAEMKRQITRLLSSPREAQSGHDRMAHCTTSLS